MSEIGRIIDLDEIPLPKRRKQSKWRKIFESIPEGKAMVFTQKEATPIAVYSALQALHGKKEFLHLRCIKRTIDGEKTSYVIHLPHGDAEE